MLETAFAHTSRNKSAFFQKLQGMRRIQPEFHVTLIHRAAAKTNPELWQKYSDQHVAAENNDHKIGSCKVMLERVGLIFTLTRTLINELLDCMG